MNPEDYELMHRPARRGRRRGKNKYGIQFKSIIPNSRLLKHWHLYQRYPTERQRDQALHDLQTKGGHKLKWIDKMYLYRKEPDKPNKLTKKALAYAEVGKDVKAAQSVEELFEELER